MSNKFRRVMTFDPGLARAIRLCQHARPWKGALRLRVRDRDKVRDRVRVPLKIEYFALM